MNWRKPIIAALLRLNNRSVLKHLQTLQETATQPSAEILTLQRERLEAMLYHAWKYVPFYTERLQRHGVVDADGTVHLEQFVYLPALYKSDLRASFDELQSTDPKREQRKPYPNTSGGSTGEPVTFTQDQVYLDWNIATKLYYKTFTGQRIGDREMRLWGSERDILHGSETLSKRLQNWLYNRHDLNSFAMDNDTFATYAEAINQFRPTWIEGYVQSLDALAEYCENHNITLHSPNGVVTTAGALYPDMQERIERVFGCKTFNRYGSREVGDMACNDETQDGLLQNALVHYLEILDEEMQPVAPGETGNIYITTLTNWSMPLIRYHIGDVGQTRSEGKEYSATCGYPLIETVRGRDVNFFRTENGGVVDGEYFTHLFYHKPWCEQFQVVQHDYNDIRIAVVLRETDDASDAESSFTADKEHLLHDIHAVMPDAQVVFSVVDTITPTASGKYLYTVSLLE